MPSAEKTPGAVRNPGAISRRVQRKMERLLEKAVTSNRSPLLFSATQKSDLVGYVFLADFTLGGMIYDIATLPAARRQGVGLRLVKSALGTARKRRWGIVIANVWEGNDASSELFKKAGFQAEASKPSRMSWLFPTAPVTVLSYDLSTQPN